MHSTSGSSVYDVVIVGGRPAGATLAARLGRRGLKVLVLDKAAFPSLPNVPSSPTVHPGVMKMLDELGIDESTYAHEDARIERFVMHFDEHFCVHMPLPRMHGRSYVYGIDRSHFDHALWQALDGIPSLTRRDRCGVADVHRDANGRVDGVVTTDGELIRASCVVGADGRFSLVARKVDAPVVNEKPEHVSTVYYADWEGVAPVSPLGHAGHVVATGRGTDVLFFPMPHGRVSINTHQRSDRVDIQGDAQAYYLKVLQSIPAVARRIAPAKQVSQVYGIKRIGNGYRQAAGPGWVLVGDALHFKDPVDGQGIYDALMEARELDVAIAAWKQEGMPWEQAMQRYEETVRQETGPMFTATTDRLRRELYSEPPVFMIRTVLRWMMTDPAYQEKFLRLLGRDIAPDALSSPGLMFGALLRGVGRDVKRLVMGAA